MILTRPRRDTITDLRAAPRVRSKLALENPKLIPAGWKDRAYPGPLSATDAMAGPGALQSLVVEARPVSS